MGLLMQKNTRSDHTIHRPLGRHYRTLFVPRGEEGRGVSTAAVETTGHTTFGVGKTYVVVYSTCGTTKVHGPRDLNDTGIPFGD